MSEYLIETMLVLFWAGYAGLNLWLWQASPLEQANERKSDRMSRSDREFNETEGAAT